MIKNPERKTPTVTVGIPAHNEEENISHMLQSVLDQKQGNYKLEKIIVLCDACTDRTAEKARKLAKKHPLITVIDDGKRKGKTGRLNQLYRMNKSDLVFNIDGDVILSGDEVLAKLVAAFKEKDVVLVSGNNQPVKALTLMERIDNAGYRMWYEIRKDYQEGHNIWNIQGMAVGLRGSFAKSFQYPEEYYVSDGGFVFITAKEQKKQFRFIKDAVIIFRSVNNLQDFFLQASRSLYQKEQIADRYGDWVYKEFYIPRKYKLQGILKSLLSDPIFTSGALALSVILRIFPFSERSWCENGGSFKTSTSTKKVIPTS